MEASCFVTSKPFGKVPPPGATAPFSRRRRRRFASSRGGAAVICCSPGLSSSWPSSDECRAPALRSDWRSYRARLVFGEREAARAETADLTPAVGRVRLGKRWAHALHEPERGCLLIATEKLDGAHIFERAVVLVLATPPAGPRGVILNRPSLMSIKETRSVALDAAGVFSERPLFFGGPREGGVFLVSPAEGKAAAGVARSEVFDGVMEGLFYGTRERVGCAVEMVKRGVAAAGDFRFFDGCCHWETEQLREEIRRGYWAVAACSAGAIAAAGACAGLRDEILAMLGEKKVR